MAKKIRYAAYIIGFIAMVALFGKDIYSRYHLKNYGNYTAGVVTGFSSGGRGTSWVNYEFVVGGNLYEGSSLYDAGVSPKIGDKFSVKYSSRDPKVSRMEFR